MHCILLGEGDGKVGDITGVIKLIFFFFFFFFRGGVLMRIMAG